MEDQRAPAEPIREPKLAGAFPPGAGLEAELQEIILATSDVGSFLAELAELTAVRLSMGGKEVLCGITVIRQRKPRVAACSSPRAGILDEEQNVFGDGPCLTALREGVAMLVNDLAHESRWPDYVSAAIRQGIGSILAVPLELAGEAQAVVNLYCTTPYGFTTEDIATAQVFTAEASASLRLALRMAQLRDNRDDLSAAMQSRTTIDMAIGAIMAQNRCARDEAVRILTRTSNARNVKLRDVAASVIASVSGETELSAHFES